MTSVHRDRVLSPSRYRRKTVGMVYSLQNSQSVPNSARLSSTPRSSSALDRRWVHRSQGDLTLDMDPHPRLQSEFYQELYQKYPHAFRRRLEAREAGRKLFNSRLHVRFKDEAEFCDENRASLGNWGNLHSNTYLTNWDREVGHYMKHKSRSRECVTSLEPSECSGSVLSVTQKLRLNSQSLNKLLNGDSPLRKHFDRGHVQYDSGTENEQSLQDYMLEKNKERSRHRKKQRRVIIQRNFHKAGSVDEEINKENEFNSRRWMSKSASPTRRHLINFSLPRTNEKHGGHQVNVESLIADSDLKIDTLFGKISTKMSSPESPPDSAIDIDTPSVQSLVTTDTKGANSGKPDKDLPVLNGQQTGSFESPHEDIESSPGSSASTYASRKCAKNSNDIMQNGASIDSSQICSDDRNEDILSVEVTTVENKPEECILKEEEEMNKIVEKYASSENLNQNNTGAGLLQLYTEDMGYDKTESSEATEKAIEKIDGLDVANDDDIKVDTIQNLPNENSTSCQADTPESGVNASNAVDKNIKSVLDDEYEIPTKEGDIKQVTDINEYPEQVKVTDMDECPEQEKVTEINECPEHVQVTDINECPIQVQVSDINECPEQVQVTDIDECQQQISDMNECPEQITDVNECPEQVTDINECPEQVNDVNELQEQVTDVNEHAEHVTDIDECLEQITDIDDYQEQITDTDEVPKQEADRNKCPRSLQLEDNINYHADDEHEADVVAMEMAQSNDAVSKRISTHRESDVDSGIGYSSAGTDMLPPRGRASQRETNRKPQPLKASHDILPLRSEVDVDILDEVNLVHLSHDLLKSNDARTRESHSHREDRDDTDVHLGFIKPSEKDKKLAEKYRRARSPSPYILLNRQPSPGFRPKSAPSFAKSEINLRVVEIPLASEIPASVQSAARYEDVYQQARFDMKSNVTLKTNSCQNTDIISKFSSMPNLPSNQSKHSKIYSTNRELSSKLIRQRQCSVTSGSSISLLSESETDAIARSCNVNYGGAIDDYDSSPEAAADEDYEKDIEDERFSEVELDSGTNIENFTENKPSELVKMIKGMYQPGVTSPRVKEKRSKIRNILKHRKGSYNPPDESCKPPDEKNIVNRIYAKVRGAVKGGTDNNEKAVEDSADHSKQKYFVDLNSLDLSDDNKQQTAVGDKNGTENSNGRRTPYESAVSTDKDTDSVNQFISGSSTTTVKAKPVVLDKVDNDSETVKTNVIDGSGDERLSIQDEGSEQIERTVSPTKAQPPKKPARNKNKNKNLNALAGQLNFSKYKIRVGEGLSADLETSSVTELSNQSPKLQDSPACGSIEEQSQTERKMSQQSELGRGASVDTSSEIEVWQPLKSTVENTENTTGKKRGSKGKFRFFKKSASMDRGIETVGMNPNPGSQGSQESKDDKSSVPKVKKAPSLKSFTSIFSRKKKKKGQFIIEDVENASSKGSSLSRSEQAYTLSNGKQQHYASCHSLETVGSSTHSQPTRRQSKDTVASHEKFQPVGRLLKVNPDGTQVIQLFKPENGPIGFFIAKGNVKCGSGIFVSRFVETRPERCFAGLLGIGDEIIEVNGHHVRDFSQDAVYSLISASAVVLVKVLPFIARKDV